MSGKTLQERAREYARQEVLFGFRSEADIVGHLRQRESDFIDAEIREMADRYFGPQDQRAYDIVHACINRQTFFWLA